MESYSVLMTVYKKDNPQYVKAGIDSMLAQTHKTNDFVLVCDGELPDELNAVIDSYADDNPDVFNIVRLPENVGLGAALRHGVPLCKNELVARMDNDDISYDFRCEKQVKRFEEQPELELIGGHVDEFCEDKKIVCTRYVPVSPEEIKKYSRRRNPFNHSTVMFKKSAILKYGNYSSMRTNQDVELWVRALNSGCRAENLDMSLVMFRFGEDTYRKRKNKANIKLMISVWKDFYKKGYCGLSDYLYVTLAMLYIKIVPTGMLKATYRALRKGR